MSRTSLSLPSSVRSFCGERSRRVGVEIEFAGLEPDRVAELIAARFGGEVTKVSGYEYRVSDTGLGNFGVEVDLRLLKRLGREVMQDAGSEDPRDELKRWSTELLARAARPLVPVEIIGPPMEVDELVQLDGLTADLRRAGAKGTGRSTVYAFGVHLNPEVPDFEAATIVAYLRAFLCLFDWLKSQGEIDLARQVTPFINRFPGDYEELVLDVDYRPGLNGLILDYLDHNATRNRALDMLPLFAHLREGIVVESLPEEKIKARPTFHYRLPNSEIDRESWTIRDAWYGWLQVEYLANDADRLKQACKARLADRKRLGSSFDEQWLEESERWLARIPRKADSNDE